VLDWIFIAILYVFAIFFFRFIGGVGAAEDGLRRWGASYGERQRHKYEHRFRD
jgi:hypothetical protein